MCRRLGKGTAATGAHRLNDPLEAVETRLADRNAAGIGESVAADAARPGKQDRGKCAENGFYEHECGATQKITVARYAELAPLRRFGNYAVLDADSRTKAWLWTDGNRESRILCRNYQIIGSLL